MNYIDKKGTFSNYYNFINNLDSFNDYLLKTLLSPTFNILMNASLIYHTEKNFVNLMD